MLELIFQGFWEWLYSLVLECWEFFSSSLLDIMSMDFSYLETRMPVITTIEQSMLAIGWALLIGNLVFQAVRSMLTGLGFEGEDPKLLFTRTFVFAFLLLASPQICELCLNMASIMIGILEVPDAVNITLADNASFAGLACAWLLVIICGIIVMFQFFKLIVEMAERYFILAVLTISAPLAFGMGGSRNTSDIFTGWCRMYGSMCLLMVLNVAFIKMLLSVLSFYPSGLDVLPWMILVLTVVKVAKKADAIVTRIGLNPAITGDSLGRTFPGALTYLVVRSAASQVTKAIGRNMGGQSKGASGSPPQGGTGNPKTAAPIGGIGHTGATTASQKAGATTQQTTAQTAETASSSDRTQVNQGGTAIGVNQQTKKTAVPPGTRRSPMHSSTARAVAANAAVAGMAAQTVAANGLHTGTAGMRTESGGIGNAEMPRPGAAGMATNTQLHRQTQTVQNGTAGMRTGGSVNGGMKTERPGSAGMRDGKSADRAATASQHGTAGMVSIAQTLRQTQTVQNGTAGMRSDTQTLQQSQTVQNGSAGTAASIGGTRFTRADAQTVRQGAAVNRMQTGAQNILSVKASKAPSGATGNSTAPSAPKENRFTQRPTAAQAPILQKPAAPQHGTAGIVPAAPAPNREARHSRNPIPAMTNQGQSAPSPARQESRQVTQAPKANVAAPSLHHGTAGIAPAKPKETQTRQTAKKPTPSAPAVPRKTVQKATSKQTERKSSVKRRSGNGK